MQYCIFCGKPIFPNEVDKWVKQYSSHKECYTENFNNWNVITATEYSWQIFSLSCQDESFIKQKNINKNWLNSDYLKLKESVIDENVSFWDPLVKEFLNNETSTHKDILPNNIKDFNEFLKAKNIKNRKDKKINNKNKEDKDKNIRRLKWNF